jgi:hypothetical protein
LCSCERGLSCVVQAWDLKEQDVVALLWSLDNRQAQHHAEEDVMARNNILKERTKAGKKAIPIGSSVAHCLVRVRTSTLEDAYYCHPYQLAISAILSLAHIPASA